MWTPRLVRDVAGRWETDMLDLCPLRLRFAGILVLCAFSYLCCQKRRDVMQVDKRELNPCVRSEREMESWEFSQ